jgi:hypothetical protein
MTVATYKKGGREPRHLMRFMKFQALSGSDSERIAAIAKTERVTESTVRESIRQIETYRSLNQKDMVDLRFNEYMMAVIPEAQRSMLGLLTATELVEVIDPKTNRKKIIKQEDKTTRLEANRIVKEMVAATQPKGPIAEVKVTNTTQIANLSGAETTEERLARLRKMANEANTLPAEVAAVPQYIDRGEDNPDDDDDSEDEDEDDGGE